MPTGVIEVLPGPDSDPAGHALVYCDGCDQEPHVHVVPSHIRGDATKVKFFTAKEYRVDWSESTRPLTDNEKGLLSDYGDSTRHPVSH